VGKTVAARFVREKPDEVIRQLEYLTYVPVNTIKSSIGAYLTDAIKNGYGPPARYEKAKKAEGRAAQQST
jgi:hypothetical protein